MIEHWTQEDIPDLNGSIAVVTGGNSGIGLAVARALAWRRARVVLACRSRRRGHDACASIRAAIPESRVEVMVLDLASLNSIRRFATEFGARHDRLDLLVNNAGVLLAPYRTTAEGFESHFGVNHLGHFALTGLLIDCLRTSRASRVITVSSRGHVFGRIGVGDLLRESGQRYSPLHAYARSKLANLLFTYELQRRLGTSHVVAVAAHPGGAATGLGRRMGERSLYRVLLPILERLSQSAEHAARPILRAATDPQVAGGEFYGPGGRLGMRGHPVRVRSSRRSYDQALAQRLWDVSEELTGVRFP